MDRLELINNELQDLRHRLRHHSMYQNLKTIHDIKVFMEYHVFAVWDFMSLLKALQIQLTTIEVPWTPCGNPRLARFINDIVREEESDFDALGIPKSHFEMYLEAMLDLGSNTRSILNLIGDIKSGISIFSALKNCDLDERVIDFLEFTFTIVESKNTHKIASAFTFGREDVIPDMFIEILNSTEVQTYNFNKLKYYLERHVVLDGDDHGPQSLEMIVELCNDKSSNWDDVLSVAKAALEKRISLWDAVNDRIIRQNELWSMEVKV